MSQKSASVHWTYDDYLHFPDDGKRYEIIEGEKLVTPAPIPRHQSVLGNLYLGLASFVRRQGRGVCYLSPIDLLLARDSVVQPDLVFISAERLSIVEEKNITAAPDLVVEILSPSTRRTDYRAKKRLYATHGVSEYWIVDPEIERVEIYLREGGELVKSAEVSEGEVASLRAVRDFSIPVQELFHSPTARS